MIENIIYVLIGGCISFFTGIYIYNMSNKEKQLLLDAFELYSNGDEVAFQSILDRLRHPDSPIARYMRGTTYYNNGMFKEAIFEFERILNRDRHNFQANFDLGLISNNVDPRLCYRYYEAALRKSPWNFSVNFNYALAVHISPLFRSGNEERREQVTKLAIYHYLRSLQILPNHPGVKKNVIDAIESSRDFNQGKLVAQIKNMELKETATEIYNGLFKETLWDGRQDCRGRCGL